MVRPSHNYVGSNAGLAQVTNSVLGRFGFKLLAGLQKRQKDQVDVQNILWPDFAFQLSDGLNKAQTFVVTNSTTDLDNMDVAALG